MNLIVEQAFLDELEKIAAAEQYAEFFEFEKFASQVFYDWDELSRPQQFQLFKLAKVKVPGAGGPRRALSGLWKRVTGQTPAAPKMKPSQVPVGQMKPSAPTGGQVPVGRETLHTAVPGYGFGSR
jgi:hypothetical protein